MEEVKKQGMESLFVPYEIALALKELGFDEKCLGYYEYTKNFLITDSVFYTNSELQNEGVTAPLYQQAINFLYICSNKQIDIELKGSDTHEERIRKIEQGCKDLWNLQNNKSK
jgi:hypothetical protein